MFCLIGRWLSAGLKVAPETIEAHLAGRSDDPRTAAILRLAQAIVETRGQASDADLEQAGLAGLTDADIDETVGNVVANIFTNYLIHVAAADIDFPVRNARAACPHHTPYAYEGRTATLPRANAGEGW